MNQNKVIYATIALLMLFVCVLTPQSAEAQKRIKLRHADKGKGKNSSNEQRLIGNVVFEQNRTVIYCDSAYYNKNENYLHAFGRVRIEEGDSVTITGRKLEYDGNTKQAKMRTNVVLTKLAKATLYTDYLDFYRTRNMAYYFNGGRLVDSINVLVSRKGYYDVNTDMASFKKEVEVTNPDYTMTSDSLQYQSRTKMIYFRTPTTVVYKDSSVFVYNNGEYDTKRKRSDLNTGAGESRDYKIKSDRYDLDDVRKIYRLRGNVVMTSKKENLSIHGESADYLKYKDVSKIYDQPYVAKVTDNNDTLYIAADTLVSIDSPDPAKKRLLAYRNVKIFKADLQGSADSLEYRAADSTIYLYKNPVLWSQGNQMTADSIQLLIKNNTIDKVFMNVNAFVISRDTLLNFNQIKGRRMTAEFRNKVMYRMVVEGNGESVYFALEENKKDSTDAKAMGMNKIICSKILIRFKDGRVDNMSFLRKPDASFIPPHELKAEDKTLKGFDWREKDKPTRDAVIRKRREEGRRTP